MLYFAPTTGGSPEDREFFDANIPLEIRNASYMVVESPEEADFLVSLAIQENGGSSGAPSFLTLGLATIADSSPLIEISYNYADVGEMYSWNLGSLLAPAAPAVLTPPPPFDDWEQTQWLYLGLRGGGAFNGYSFQQSSDYNAGYSAGISTEWGLAAELRLLRFLSLQLEGDFVYEVFNAPKTEGSVYSSDTFRSMSFMFPLMAKVPLKFEKFSLSFCAGLYYIITPWGLDRTEGEDSSYRIDPPLGFTVGVEAGFPAGPGVLFADARYYKRSFGTTIIGNGAGPLYIQDRISLCVGYKFGFFWKK
jgi:hypothetical protein